MVKKDCDHKIYEHCYISTSDDILICKHLTGIGYNLYGYHVFSFLITDVVVIFKLYLEKRRILYKKNSRFPEIYKENTLIYHSIM